MVMIGNVVVTDEALGECFACDLAACRGGCCVHGGDGPPLTAEEAVCLADSAADLDQFMDEAGRAAVRKHGPVLKDATGTHTVPLIAGGRCAFALEIESVVSCGIQQAHEARKIPWPKPVSCHLYPLRIVEKPPFSVVTCDLWDICGPARERGRREGVPLLRFCAAALERRFGREFVEETRHTFVEVRW